MKIIFYIILSICASVVLLALTPFAFVYFLYSTTLDFLENVLCDILEIFPKGSKKPQTREQKFEWMYGIKNLIGNVSNKK